MKSDWFSIFWVALAGSGFCGEEPTGELKVAGSLKDFSHGGTRFGVLVSVNEYAENLMTPTLDGPKNDMDTLARVMVKKFNFRRDQILRLHGPGATKRAIEKALKALISRAKPGNQLVFAFAGHGSYRVDRHKNEEGDGRDETICPYDRDIPEVGDLTDDLLFGFFSGILKRGAFLTVIVDACHSGNVSKNDGPMTLRTAPALSAGNGKNRPSPKDDFFSFGKRFTFLAAAEEHQEAGERYFEAGLLPKGVYGIFSHALNRALREAEPNWTWDDLVGSVKRRTRSHNHHQQPVFSYGRNIRIFGPHQTPKESRFRVSAVTNGGASIQLEQGVMSGLELDTLLEVYARRTKENNARETVIARYRITEAEPHRATASLVAEGSPIPGAVKVDCPIRIIESHQTKPWQVSWSADLPDTLRIQLIKTIKERPELTLKESENVSPLQNGFTIHLITTQDNQPALRLEGPPTPVTVPFRGLPPSSVADRLLDPMIHTVYWHRLLGIKGPHHAGHRPSPVEVVIERGQVNPDFGEYLPLSALPRHRKTGRHRFYGGDVLRVSYTNLSQKTLFVTILFLNNQAEVICWNHSQFRARVRPGRKVVVGDWIGIGPPFGREWVKVFINTEKPFDPQPFLQGAKGQEEADPLFSTTQWWIQDFEIQTIPNPGQRETKENEAKP